MRSPCAIIIAVTLAVTACGAKNECEKMLELNYNAWSEACTDKTNECCFCKCWNEGHKLNDYNSSTKKCECNVTMPSDVPDELCTEAYKAQVKTCFDNEKICTDGLKTQVNDPKYGKCVKTPL